MLAYRSPQGFGVSTAAPVTMPICSLYALDSSTSISGVTLMHARLKKGLTTRVA
jgi:hypothetical protein